MQVASLCCPLWSILAFVPTSCALSGALLLSVIYVADPSDQNICWKSSKSKKYHLKIKIRYDNKPVCIMIIWIVCAMVTGKIFMELKNCCLMCFIFCDRDQCMYSKSIYWCSILFFFVKLFGPLGIFVVTNLTGQLVIVKGKYVLLSFKEPSYNGVNLQRASKSMWGCLGDIWVVSMEIHGITGPTNIIPMR